MEDKTLGQVAREAWLAGTGPLYVEWDSIADVVTAAHEARRWKGIETLPADRKQVIIGYRCEGLGWVQTFWFTETKFTPPVEYTHWTEAPAPPKEASDAEYA